MLRSSLSTPFGLIVAGLCCAWGIVATRSVDAATLAGSVASVVSQLDGKVIIAGPFSSIGGTARAGIARLASDGSLDPSFDPGPGANGAINLLALQDDGKVLIAGDFTAVNGVVRNRIARLGSDGALDQGFNPGGGPNDIINVLLIDADGKAVLGGKFETFDGITRHFLARLNKDGRLDLAFDAGLHLSRFDSVLKGVTDLDFYPDGRLIAGGFFMAGSKYDFVRVALDGTIDSNFKATGVSIQAIAVQPDGKVYVSGPVNGSNGGLIRLNPDGTTDPTFTAASGSIFGVFLRVQPDGKVLFVGNSGPVIRFNPNGSADSSFGPVQSNGGTYRALELRPDGRILLAGSFSTVNGSPRSGVVRLFQNGQVDPGFIPEAGVVTAGSIGLNFSTRGVVGTSDDVLIGGFFINGSSPKRLMIRAIGPSLATGSITVPRPLLDPTLELYDSRTLIARNNDWRVTQVGGVIGGDQREEIEQSTIAPLNAAESAIIATLDPGVYTAIVRGVNNGTGIGLVELYDLDPSATARLANISTRGRVGIGDDVIIGGITLGGTELSKVVLRAIGPSLSTAGVTDPLADPTLALHNGNGAQIVTNDDWKDIQQGEIEATGLAPSNDKEAAILAVIAPGSYTAIVRGTNNGMGIAVVEAFALPK
jgi:uncharacterized delta-60 repeat protein